MLKFEACTFFDKLHQYIINLEDQVICLSLFLCL
jgi:hypothetical protein